MYNALTDVPGIQVGHWTDRSAGTGCTVILCPQGAVAGVDVRGGAPGTREIALLDPLCMVQRVHGIMLSGGSAFGLSAADGAMRWLEEHDCGFDVGITKVPIVPAAILFDLSMGRADVRPGPHAGYAACAAASSGSVEEGSVGAGTGATVGKIFGLTQATKGGLGVASRVITRPRSTADDSPAPEIVIGALAAVNAFGDVLDPATQQIIAGARDPATGAFANVLETAAARLGQMRNHWDHYTNTTLGVVATNVPLDKTGCTKVAQMAHDGLARAIRPVHSQLDGDIVFALSLDDGVEQMPVDAGLVGALAADVLATAIVRAVRAATSLHGVPAVADL